MQYRGRLFNQRRLGNRWHIPCDRRRTKRPSPGRSYRLVAKHWDTVTAQINLGGNENIDIRIIQLFLANSSLYILGRRAQALLEHTAEMLSKRSSMPSPALERIINCRS